MPTIQTIVVPSMGESVTEASIARWLKSPGSVVVMDEPLIELETDKVTLEIMAPVSGVLKDHLHPVGAVVAVGTLLAHIEPQDQGAAASVSASVADPAAAPKAEASPMPPISTTVSTTGGTSGPGVRKLMDVTGVDVASVEASGKDGRITRSDVLKAHTTPVGTAVGPVVGGNALAAAPSHQGATTVVPMSKLRLKIAERLKSAQNTAAMLTTFNEIDMSATQRLRQKYKDGFEKKYGVKLGFMGLFAKSVVQALKELPALNAEIQGSDIIYKHFYNIGMAVGAPQGLVVPVIKDADLLTLAGIEHSLKTMATKAKEGKLSVDDLMGGTFTITNGGVYGSLMSTPIINPPQVGILGLHKIQDRPMVVNGAITICPMMYVALSYDHRLIDGKDAVTFLVRVKELMEDPERLLLEI